jgi:hypothetical protein
MKPKEDGGLGLREVLEYIGVPYKNNETTERAEKPALLLLQGG